MCSKIFNFLLSLLCCFKKNNPQDQNQKQLQGQQPHRQQVFFKQSFQKQQEIYKYKQKNMTLQINRLKQQLKISKEIDKSWEKKYEQQSFQFETQKNKISFLNRQYQIQRDKITKLTEEILQNQKLKNIIKIKNKTSSQEEINKNQIIFNCQDKQFYSDKYKKQKQNQHLQLIRIKNQMSQILQLNNKKQLETQQKIKDIQIILQNQRKKFNLEKKQIQKKHKNEIEIITQNLNKLNNILAINQINQKKYLLLQNQKKQIQLKNEKIVENYDKQINNKLKKQQLFQKQKNLLQLKYQTIIKNYETQMIEKQKLIEKLKDQSNLNNNCFCGKIVKQNLQKRFLANSIETYTKKTIIETVLVYYLDPLNSNNIHKYIDGVKNTFVIIKTSTNQIIGVYSKAAFEIQKNQEQNQNQAFLFSLTMQKIFPFKQNNSKVLHYDDYYLIYGKSDLRLKTNQKKVYSSLGIKNSQFQSKQISSCQFLNYSEKQVAIEGYEIFQIIFK